MAVDFVSMTPAAQMSFLMQFGQQAYRHKQVEEWIYQKGCLTWDEMTNLPKQLREQLNCSGIPVLTPHTTSALESDWVSKFGVTLFDGEIVETVAMRYTYGFSLCVSTQVGCRMGCTFCASTDEGLLRNLSAAEILAQVLLVNSRLVPQGERIGNIVIMGMGEPLDNYDNVVEFLHLVTEKVGIGARRITLSTCGVVPGIYRLAEEGLPITLSVSLHAANDELREKIMPVSKAYPVRELLKAMRHFGAKTGRRVSAEYTLIEGINDDPESARQLAKLLGKGFHVNLIAVNPIERIQWNRPSQKKIQQFGDILREAGLNVTLRRELGLEIEGSCGQLRRGAQKQE